MTTKRLTWEEIRTATMIVNTYQAAMARAAMAQELEIQFMAQLREKYGLDDSWVCNDLLVGFVRVESVETNDQNH